MISVLMCLPVLAQEIREVEMADVMRSNGKIYVVIAVILTILTGLILYVVRLDRKISKLEKEK
jgi:hypothetical protein